MEHVKEDLWLALMARLQVASQWMVLPTGACPHHPHRCPKKIPNPNHHLHIVFKKETIKMVNKIAQNYHIL